MTHARKKQLFLLKRPAGSAGQVSSPTGNGRMDRTQAECGEQRDGDATEAASSLSGFVGTSKSKNLQEVRKTYPLRRRLLPSVNKKTCKVLLTRLEDVAGSLSKETQSCKKKDLPSWVEELGPTFFAEQVKPVGAGKSDSAGEKCTITYPGTEEDLDAAPSEPRKRRLASLNAEAVNNLLFERDDGLLSGRRFRRDPAKASGDCTAKSLHCKAGDSWPALEKTAVKTGKGKNRHEPSQKYNSCDHSLDEVFDDGLRREDSAISYHPTPKRLASLNAVAFLKLTHEKDQPLKQRSKSDGEGKSENHCSKSTPKWAKANRKNCVKSKKEAASLKMEGQHSWRGLTLGAFGKAEQQDSSRLYRTAQPVPYESQSSTEGFYHRLPLLMGGQAAMKPEYGRPGEKSPTPKQEFHQPSFPVQQFPPLPVPGNHTDCGCLYESSDLTPLNGFYVCYGQSGYRGYSHCSVYPKDELLQPATCEGLLVSPGSLPSGTHFQPLHWCSSPYCCGEGTAINSYSVCGVVHVPDGRISSVHTGRNSYPYKMPFAAGKVQSTRCFPRNTEQDEGCSGAVVIILWLIKVWDLCHRSRRTRVLPPPVFSPEGFSPLKSPLGVESMELLKDLRQWGDDSWLVTLELTALICAKWVASVPRCSARLLSILLHHGAILFPKACSWYWSIPAEQCGEAGSASVVKTLDVESCVGDAVL